MYVNSHGVCFPAMSMDVKPSQTAKENQAAGVHSTESPDTKGSEVPEAAQAASEFAEKVNLSAKPKTMSWAAANIPTPQGKESNETPLWQELARLAPQTFGFYKDAADSLQSIDRQVTSFAELLEHWQLSVHCKVFLPSAPSAPSYTSPKKMHAKLQHVSR